MFSFLRSVKTTLIAIFTPAHQLCLLRPVVVIFHSVAKSNVGPSRLQNAGGAPCDGGGAEKSRAEGYPKKKALASVKCEDRSLTVFEGEAYYDLWHGVACSPGTLPRNRLTKKEQQFTSNSAGRDNGRCTFPPPRYATESCNGCSSCGGHVGSLEKKEQAKSSEGAAWSTHACLDSNSGSTRRCSKRLSFTIRRVAKVVSADSVMEHAEGRIERERRRMFFERSVTETGVPALAGAGIAAR